MKKLLFFWLLLGVVACQHEDTTFRSEGRITGVDFRYCACCGGWFIEIGTEKYRAYLSEAEIRDLNLSETVYPVPVRLDWEAVASPCLGDEIIVTRIKRR